MSRQSKMSRKKVIAKQFKGNKGPARTETKHGKKKAWFQLKDAAGKLIGRNKPKAAGAND